MAVSVELKHKDTGVEDMVAQTLKCHIYKSGVVVFISFFSLCPLLSCPVVIGIWGLGDSQDRN